jgi:hypothetical protein
VIRTPLVALAAAAALVVPSAALAAPPGFIGSMHEHSAYSDGYPTTRPATFYASGRDHGLDFMLGSDHSDTLGLPISVSQDCEDDPTQNGCAIADTTNPQDSFRKWDATLDQAQAGTTSSFTAVRGFEWTSDRFGHINVYFSDNYRNAKDDGGYASMESFYTWLTSPLLIGGGADGLATFNHPGDKKLSDSDPAFNWNDFAYVPAADDQMVGIETYNGDDHAAPGAHGGPAEGWYAHALDKGWHLGAVGAEDLGHHRGDDWGGPTQPKTVILAADRSAQALKTAMQQRRFYAVRTPGYRMSYTVDGAPMGSRLTRAAGQKLHFQAHATDATGRGLRDAALELVTTGGKVVATGAGGRLDVRRPAVADERWYFVRVHLGDEFVAYSSPVWVTT